MKNDPESKYTISTNRWDRRTRDRIAENVKEFQIAAGELDELTATGYEAMVDSLMALYKVDPRLRDRDEVRPSYLINQAVMKEMMDLKLYDDVRDACMGDTVATGLSAAQLEPELEVIFDKMKTAQEKAAKLEELLAQAEDASSDIDDMLDKMSDHEFSDEEEDALAAAQEALDKLQSDIDDSKADLEDEIDQYIPDIRASLRDGLNEAMDINESLRLTEAWGLGRGATTKLDSSKRLELAKKLNNDRFKLMAEILGRLQNLAISEQLKHTDKSSEEIFSITRGNDIGRLLPVELLYLDDETLVYEWLHRFSERLLLQYDLRGKERVNRGGIVVVLDSSSSMRGDRSVWAKAIALALLSVARNQKRPMTVIEFSGTNMMVTFDFLTEGNDLSMTVKDYTSAKEPERTVDGIEAIVEYAEFGLYGGTCFTSPLTLALNIFEEEYAMDGSVNGDIVFLTDGHSDVPSKFQERFLSKKQELGFKMYGIGIGSEIRREPMSTLCDEVVTLQRLMDTKDLTPIFSGVTRDP